MMFEFSQDAVLNFLLNMSVYSITLRLFLYLYRFLQDEKNHEAFVVFIIRVIMLLIFLFIVGVIVYIIAFIYH